jgi:hypothetical protein
LAGFDLTECGGRNARQSLTGPFFVEGAELGDALEVQTGPHPAQSRKRLFNIRWVMRRHGRKTRRDIVYKGYDFIQVTIDLKRGLVRTGRLEFWQSHAGDGVAPEQDCLAAIGAGGILGRQTRLQSDPREPRSCLYFTGAVCCSSAMGCAARRWGSGRVGVEISLDVQVTVGCGRAEADGGATGTTEWTCRWVGKRMAH